MDITVRRAEIKDIDKVSILLSEVLELHAKLRPDIFISGTTKYTKAELSQIIKDDNKPVFVAVNEKDVCIGYSFCQIKEQPFSNNMVSFKSIFIDDLLYNLINGNVKKNILKNHITFFIKEFKSDIYLCKCKYKKTKLYKTLYILNNEFYNILLIKAFRLIRKKTSFNN